MAGGGSVTRLLATRAAAALLAGHCVAAVAVEGGGGESRGGSLTYLYLWPQGHSWRVEVGVEVTGGNRPGGPWGRHRGRRCRH